MFLSTFQLTIFPSSSLFFEWISCQLPFFSSSVLQPSFCNSLHPLSLSHSTISPSTSLKELAKQISVDANGCLSFLKAEVKGQSECVCACVWVLMKSKEKKKEKKKSKALKGSSANGGRDSISWADIWLCGYGEYKRKGNWHLNDHQKYWLLKN